MSKQSLLSAEISRNRALLAGGLRAQDAAAAFREWLHRAPLRGKAATGPGLIGWGQSLTCAIDDTLALGAPVGVLLREAQPMVRKEESRWSRLKAMERQFGFQGAVALVLPWGVAGIAGGLSVNLFSLLGAGLQAIGLAAFYFFVKHAGRNHLNERAWVFEFLVAAWMRNLAGMSLQESLRLALSQAENGRSPLEDRCRQAWEDWITALSSGSDANGCFNWPRGMEQSSETAPVLAALLRNGAPASEALADLIRQLDDDRTSEMEERLAGLPTRLSLAFCFFLTPAVFVILLGALWPSLSVLSI